MSKNCAICGEAVRTKNSGTNCDGECGKWYHYKCHNVAEKSTTVPRVDGKQWKCARCGERVPLAPLARLNVNLGAAAGGSVSRSADTTPVGSPSATGPFSMSVDVGNTLTKLQRDVQKMLQSQTAIELSISKIEKAHQEMQKSVDFFMEKIHVFEARFEEHNTKITVNEKTIESLVPEVQKLKKEVSLLQAQRDDAEQRVISDLVEIKGIPDSSVNLVDTVLSIAAAVECTMQPADILQVRRAPSKKQVLKGQQKEKDSPLHVQFAKNLVRDAFLKSMRVKRRLSSRDIGLHSQEERPIFVNELLTYRRKMLLSTAKNFAKTNNIKYVWVRNGLILMRKESGDKAFIVRQEGDLDAFFR